MPIVRIVFAFLMLLVVVGSVYGLLAILDLEGARRWAPRLIIDDMLVLALICAILVIACLFGAGWLLRPKRPPGGRSITTLVRTVFAILLLLFVGFCIIQAIAAEEVPEARWAYRLFDGTVGLASVLEACWLIWPRRPLA